MKFLVQLNIIFICEIANSLLGTIQEATYKTDAAWKNSHCKQDKITSYSAHNYFFSF